ncbi:MAG: hypothetical protein DVB28_000218 [Verrucomicrobia bacterium]|nr:MAG: hypothetical protein DVB28_000218 [Verrucomicrobiota bacterium]
MKRPDFENNPPPGPKVVPLEVVGEIPRESEASRVPPPASGQASTPGKGGTARFLVTLAVAALADGAEVLFPMAWVPIDLATVGVFFLLWGVRWEVALVLIPELIPGANVFPSWVLLALYLGNKRL